MSMPVMQPVVKRHYAAMYSCGACNRRKKDHGRAEALLIAAWSRGLRGPAADMRPQSLATMPETSANGTSASTLESLIQINNVSDRLQLAMDLIASNRTKAEAEAASMTATELAEHEAAKVEMKQLFLRQMDPVTRERMAPWLEMYR